MQLNRLDTSAELHVYRFNNGIKLIRPSDRNKDRKIQGWQTGQTVSTLLKFPCSVYFDKADGVIQQLNEHNIELCGLDSTKQAIGKTYFNNFTSKTAQILLKNDHEVITEEKIQIFEEAVLQRGNDSVYQTLSVKMPWYDNQNAVIGLFGFSIILGKNSVADSLALIANMRMLIPRENLSAQIGFELNGVYLSKQQRICANLLLLGISIKEIAIRMNLSPRTVESYIDHIKSKLKCYNKTELIIKLYELMKCENISAEDYRKNLS